MVRCPRLEPGVRGSMPDLEKKFSDRKFFSTAFSIITFKYDLNCMSIRACHQRGVAEVTASGQPGRWCWQGIESHRGSFESCWGSFPRLGTARCPPLILTAFRSGGLLYIPITGKAYDQVRV